MYCCSTTFPRSLPPIFHIYYIQFMLCYFCWYQSVSCVISHPVGISRCRVLSATLLISVGVYYQPPCCISRCRILLATLLISVGVVFFSHPVSTASSSPSSVILWPSVFSSAMKTHVSFSATHDLHLQRSYTLYKRVFRANFRNFCSWEFVV
jgi:hypothetical protein